METRSATTLKTGELKRSYQLSASTLNKEKRTVKVIASTDAPVKRWFGSEVLAHSAGNVRMDRLKGGAAVYMEHSYDRHSHCGVTESATLGQNSIEVELRFARDADGDFAMNRVEDGIYKFVSVGYHVHKFEVSDDESEYRAVDWEPLEVSLVGIPADPQSKILRTADNTHESIVMKRNLLLSATAPTEGNAPAAPNIVTKEDFSRQLDEAREIVGIQAHYQRTHPEIVELCEKALTDKMPLRDFQRKVIDIVSKPKTETAQIVSSQPNTRTSSGSIGERFVQSQGYKDALKRGIKRGNHFAVEIPDLNSFHQRATFSLSVSDISGSADIGGTGGTGIDIRPQFNLLNQQPLALTNLFSQGTTGGDQVRIVRELTFTNSATRVSEGGNKPEGQLDIGVVNFTVEKTAVFLNVTEEMLADQAQAASFINSRLAYMVGGKEDDFVINGTGSSQITGILNTSGIQTLSAATNPIDQFKRGKAYVEGANNSGYVTPDSYVMNPLDWLNASLTKDNNGQYLFGGPGYAPYGVGGYSNVSMMWGLPVVTSAFVPAGTALVGAFKQGGQVARRAGITIRTTDSHASNFIANITTVLAESRFALVVYQPNNFLSFTGIPQAS